MHLFNLPQELLLALFEQIVCTLGLQRAMRARLVCKRFAKEIDYGICTTDVLATPIPCTDSRPDWLLIRYLKVNAARGARDGHPMSLSIERGARYLLDRGKLSSRAECLHEVCRCLVQSDHRQRILDYWEQSGEAISERPKAYSELKDDAHERYSFLALAAWTGDLEYLQATTETVPYCDSWRLWPDSLITTAAYQSHLDVFQYLVNCDGARNNLPRALGAGAGTAGHKEIARVLLDRRHEFGLDNEHIIGAVEEAAENGHLEVLQYLLDHSDFPRNKLHHALRGAALSACKGGHIKIVEYLLPRVPIRHVQTPVPSHRSCLHIVCRRGHLDVAALILPAIGSDFMTYATTRSCDYPRYDDPLCTAAKYGHASIVRLLLLHGAPVDGVHSKGGKSTPLGRAAEHGQYPAAEVLLRNGASVEGKIGAHIMTQVVTRGEESMIKLLVERGCDLDQGCMEPPIVTAAKKKQWAIFKLLEQLGARRPPELTTILSSSEAGGTGT